jgi:hypothetical protein
VSEPMVKRAAYPRVNRPTQTSTLRGCGVNFNWSKSNRRVVGERYINDVLWGGVSEVCVGEELSDEEFN